MCVSTANKHDPLPFFVNIWWDVHKWPMLLYILLLQWIPLLLDFILGIQLEIV